MHNNFLVFMTLMKKGFYSSGLCFVVMLFGIGASTAQVILSSMSTNEIKNAILSGNTLKFSAVKGIGSKTAQRLILELKDKMLKISLYEENIFPSEDNKFKDEALSALLTLGFNNTPAVACGISTTARASSASWIKLIHKAINHRNVTALIFSKIR